MFNFRKIITKYSLLALIASSIVAYIVYLNYTLEKLRKELIVNEIQQQELAKVVEEKDKFFKKTTILLRELVKRNREIQRAKDIESEKLNKYTLREDIKKEPELITKLLNESTLSIINMLNEITKEQ